MIDAWAVVDDTDTVPVTGGLGLDGDRQRLRLVPILQRVGDEVDENTLEQNPAAAHRRKLLHFDRRANLVDVISQALDGGVDNFRKVDGNRVSCLLLGTGELKEMLDLSVHKCDTVSDLSCT